MKVTASSVELQSSHRFAQSLETRERLEVWRGTRDSGSAAESTQPPVVALSAAGQNALAAESATAAVDAVAGRQSKRSAPRHADPHDRVPHRRAGAALQHARPAVCRRRRAWL